MDSSKVRWFKGERQKEPMREENVPVARAGQGKPCIKNGNTTKRTC